MKDDSVGKVVTPSGDPQTLITAAKAWARLVAMFKVPEVTTGPKPVRS